MRRVLVPSITTVVLIFAVFVVRRVYCEEELPSAGRGLRKVEEQLPGAGRRLRTIEACVNLAQQAGNRIQEGDYSGGLHVLYEVHAVGGIQVEKEEEAFLSGTKARMVTMELNLGGRIEDGFEYLGYLKLGDSLGAVYFNSKYEYGSLIWKFSFYKARKEWKFHGAGFGPEYTREGFFLSKPVTSSVGVL